MDSLEGLFLRPRQVRYQAALRPDITGNLDSKAVSSFIKLELLRSSGGRFFAVFQKPETQQAFRGSDDRLLTGTRRPAK